jgi:hypothetical protein
MAKKSPSAFGALLMIAAGIAVSCYLLSVTLDNSHKADTLQDLKISLIGDLSTKTSGFFWIKGKVKSQGKSVESPFSHQSCVFYQFLVEQRSGKSWKAQVDDWQSVPFVIDDGTGQATVRMEEADLQLDAQKFDSGANHEVPPELEALLNERYHVSSQGMVFNHRTRYQETILREGDEISVIGTVVPGASKPMRFFKGGRGALFVTDKAPEFLREQYQSNYSFGVFFILFISLLFVVGGLIQLFSSSERV